MTTQPAIAAAGHWRLGSRTVWRMGYGAMQLAGPGAFGPPRDPAEALAVLRAAIAAGINHIDTSDYYGPHTTNRLIREALAPYRPDLVIVTKLGARRDDHGAWLPAASPADLRAGVEDNLRHLGLDAIDVVNFRAMFGHISPAEGSIAPMLTELFRMQDEGLIRHVGISNVTPAQVAEARAMGPIVCVQNAYNIAMRGDDALIDDLAAAGIAYVPFFPLGGFSPLQSARLDAVAARLGHTPMQVALAWLLQRSPNILLIPGTSSRAHLAQNCAAATITLDAQTVAELDHL